MKHKILPFLLMGLFLLSACQPTPDHEFVVQKDTDRLIETVIEKNNTDGDSAKDAAETNNPLVKTDKHYTYDYTSSNERLRIHADADVYMPLNGKVPMARVKGGYFTDDFAKKLFDLVYEGTTAYIRTNETRRLTKSELAEMIVYYQDLVDTGSTEDKMMDEEEAIEFINKMKEEYKTAPDEPEEIKPIVSDGTMQFRDITDDAPYARFSHIQYYELWTAGERGEISMYRPADNDPSIQDSLVYWRKPIDDTGIPFSYSESSEKGLIIDFSCPFDYVVCHPDDMNCAYGQKLSPYNAVLSCRAYLDDLGVMDAEPISYIDTYVLYSSDRSSVADCYYFIDFVRTVNGTPVAYLSMIDALDESITELPWTYETMRFIVNSEGVSEWTWTSPVRTEEILSNDAAILSFEQAAAIFETMSTIIYEAKTDKFDSPVYLDLSVSKAVLAPIRIREKNSQGRTGLYVPAWVFYGKKTGEYAEPITREMIEKTPTTVLLVINAVDGSIIDLRTGY